MALQNNLPMYASPEEKLSIFGSQYTNLENNTKKSINLPTDYFLQNQGIAIQETPQQEIILQEPPTITPTEDWASAIHTDVAYDFKQKNYINKKSELPDPSTMAKKFLRKSNIVENSITKEIDELDLSDENKSYLKLLQQIESGSNPNIENSGGFAGLYQFGKSALSQVNISKEDYLANTLNQHLAALKLKELNLKKLYKYVGMTVDGIVLNENNLQAAQHLGGTSSVLKFISSGGKDVFVDGNNVPITAYLILFQ